jgi:hypothetical protein
MTAFAFMDEVVYMVEATDATYERAKEHFSDRALTEMLYVCHLYVCCALVGTGRVPLDETPAPSPQQVALP